MRSVIAEKVPFAFRPVAILWSNEKPEGALQMKPHARMCIMSMFVQVTARGKTVVFDRETYGCPGAKAGLGFGNGYYDAFGGAGVEFMAAFFTKGRVSSRDPDAYCATIRNIPRNERAKFIEGERLHRDTDKARRFMTEELPITDIREKYVVFKPLEEVNAGEQPVVVVFVADPLQVTGLVTLAGAVREGTDPVRVPPMAACQQMGAFAYDEARKEKPRAVLGYTDLAARLTVGKAIPPGMFTFAIPYSLFTEMEEEAQDGVFDGPIWKALASSAMEEP